MNGNFITQRTSFKPVQIRKIIRIIKEYRIATVSALYDMHWDMGNNKAGLPWHNITLLW
jgi:hypothetical protein